MPVRRKKRGIVSKKRFKFNYFWLLGVIFLLMTWVYTKNMFKRHFWSGKDKLNMAINLTTGDIAQLIFDPVAGEITTILIPADTQVEVAQDKGVWRLGSVWNLGKSEGKGGELLTRTISKSLKFPVYVWADNAAFGFTSPRIISILKAVFLPYKTNLSLGDKLEIGLFSFKVKNVDRIEIDLEKTTFLKQETLEDGTNGFILSGLPSPKLYSNFIDDNFVKGTPRVVIRDKTGDFESSKSVGELIEIMGGKVSAITKDEPVDMVCEVSSKKAELAGKVAILLGCNKNTKSNPDNFDLEIVLGNKFAQSF